MDYDGGTTAVIAYVRRKVTPTMLWSAIGTLVAALVVAITWIVNTQSDVRQLKEGAADSRKQMADMQARLEVLNEIRKDLAVMGGKVDTIAEDVKRQREWRERIEDAAEAPPHARRRLK